MPIITLVLHPAPPRSYRPAEMEFTDQTRVEALYELMYERFLYSIRRPCELINPVSGESLTEGDASKVFALESGCVLECHEISDGASDFHQQMYDKYFLPLDADIMRLVDESRQHLRRYADMIIHSHGIVLLDEGLTRSALARQLEPLYSFYLVRSVDGQKGLLMHDLYLNLERLRAWRVDEVTWPAFRRRFVAKLQPFIEELGLQGLESDIKRIAGSVTVDVSDVELAEKFSSQLANLQSIINQWKGESTTCRVVHEALAAKDDLFNECRLYPEELARELHREFLRASSSYRMVVRLFDRGAGGADRKLTNREKRAFYKTMRDITALPWREIPDALERVLSVYEAKPSDAEVEASSSPSHGGGSGGSSGT